MSKEEEVLAALKEAITEARGVLKDFKHERKQLQALYDGAVVEVKNLVEQRIDDQVHEGLQAYQKTLEKATKDATAAVFRRFDTLADIMMGTDDPNKESLATLVRRWKANGN